MNLDEILRDGEKGTRTVTVQAPWDGPSGDQALARLSIAFLTQEALTTRDSYRSMVIVATRCSWQFRRLLIECLADVMKSLLLLVDVSAHSQQLFAMYLLCPCLRAHDMCPLLLQPFEQVFKWFAIMYRRFHRRKRSCLVDLQNGVTNSNFGSLHAFNFFLT